MCKCVLGGARVRARACVIVCTIERREQAKPARMAAGCVHPKNIDRFGENPSLKQNNKEKNRVRYCCSETF